VPALVALARAFLGLRAAGGSPAWHVAELAEPLLLPALGSPRPTVAAATASAGPRPTHPVGAVRGHAVAGVPLGLLTRAHVDAVAAATDRVVVTPWRSLVLEDAAAHLEALAASGLITASDSPWLRLHACTGLPGCARSALDTRALARELAPRMPPGSLPVHVSGCERRCGTPRSGYVDLLTPASADSALALIPSEPR
jgi:precorrin-3B synthase